MEQSLSMLFLLATGVLPVSFLQEIYLFTFENLVAQAVNSSLRATGSAFCSRPAAAVASTTRQKLWTLQGGEIKYLGHVQNY